MSNSNPRRRVKIHFNDGTVLECSYVESVGFSQFGTFEITHPRRIADKDVPSSTIVMLPWLPGSAANIKYVVLSDEPVIA